VTLPDTTTHRTCTMCRDYLPFSASVINKNDRFGRAHRCKPCAAAHARNYYKMRVETREVISDPENRYQVCTECGQDLPLTAFRRDAARPLGCTPKCKDCMNLKRPGVMWVRAFKAVRCCEVCGESEPCCLDFHHRDPQAKEHAMSELVWRGAVEELEAEAEKCMLLCSNCHRKVHAGVLEVC
jgi:hypothetical protein